MPMVAPTVTGHSEFWGGSAVYAPLGVRSGLDRRAMQLVAKSRPLRAVLDAYINSGATPAFTDTYKRVEAVADTSGQDLGGARPVETVTAVSATGNAAIVAQIDALLDEFHEDIVYVEDSGGNGGGGKARF